MRMTPRRPLLRDWACTGRTRQYNIRCDARRIGFSTRHSQGLGPFKPPSREVASHRTSASSAMDTLWTQHFDH